MLHTCRKLEHFRPQTRAGRRKLQAVGGEAFPDAVSVIESRTESQLDAPDGGFMRAPIRRSLSVYEQLATAIISVASGRLAGLSPSGWGAVSALS